MNAQESVARSETRVRILDAAMACIGAEGIGGFSLEEVATQAGVSRATIYRVFPNGRSEVVSSVIEHEVALFWRHLADFVEGSPNLQIRLVDGLMEAHRQIGQNDLLQRLLAAEPGALVPAIADTGPVVHDLLVGYLTPVLKREGVADELIVDGAPYLARMFVSHIASPGSWDLTDRAQVDRLIRDQFIAWTRDGDTSRELS